MLPLPTAVNATAHVRLDVSQARMIVEGVPDRPGTAAEIFVRLADAGIVVGLIVETIQREGLATLSFTLPEAQRHKAFETAPARVGGAERKPDGHERPDCDPAGNGRLRTGLSCRRRPVFRALATAEINVQMINSSSAKWRWWIRIEDAPVAAKVATEVFRKEHAAPNTA